jgi:hypothetical protein
VSGVRVYFIEIQTAIGDEKDKQGNRGAGEQETWRIKH